MTQREETGKCACCCQGKTLLLSDLFAGLYRDLHPWLLSCVCGVCVLIRLPVDLNISTSFVTLFLSPLQSRLLVLISYISGACTVHRLDGRTRHFQAPTSTNNSDFFPSRGTEECFHYALRLTTTYQAYQETPRLSLN